MCYNNCEYERYNPITGECRCVRRKNPCPEEAIICPYCDWVMPRGEYKECPCCGIPILEED